MSDMLLKNGIVVDGTGNPWFRADVQIVGERIASIGTQTVEKSKDVMDIRGNVVSPGFIDIHNHADLIRKEGSILVHNHARNLVAQGITTLAVGNCGDSAAPLTPEYRNVLRTKMKGSRETEVDWLTFAQWAKKCRDKGLALNIAPFAGFGTIRRSVMGEEGAGGERSQPNQEEVQRMKAMVEQAMREGAFGMTTGLEYAPQVNAYTEEVIELCRVVGQYGGVYMSHIRSECACLIEAVKEFISICEHSHIAGSISHHKACSPSSWGKISETMRLIEEARNRGIDVICDSYPWLMTATTNLGRQFLSPDEDLNIDALLQQLKNPGEWNRIKREAIARVEKKLEEQEKRKRKLADQDIALGVIWDPRTYYYVVCSRTKPELVNRNFTEIARLTGKGDPWEAMRWLYLEDYGETHVASGYCSEEDKIATYRRPWTAVSTDSYIEDEPQGLHPRMYGTYPRFLERYVRELKIMTLEEGIRRMTSLPAQFLGLRDRGLVKTGFRADLVVFDPQSVKSRATFSSPQELPEGIAHVIVNGETVMHNGKSTGTLPGEVLRRERGE